MEKGGAYTNVLTADNGFVFTRSGPSLGGVSFGGNGESDGGSGLEEPGSESNPDAQIALYCSVSMGGENVTTQSFDISTGEITIDEVTGPVVIRTWADEHT